MPDNTDMRAFRRIAETGAGMRFKVATQESAQALRYIRAAQHCQDEKMLDSWRRNYIQACNNASKAIDAMVTSFHWPPDSSANHQYVWVPKGARRWTWLRQ